MRNRSIFPNTRRVLFVVSGGNSSQFQEGKPTTDGYANTTKYLVDHNIPKFEIIIVIDTIVQVYDGLEPLTKEEPKLAPFVSFEQKYFPYQHLLPKE